MEGDTLPIWPRPTATLRRRSSPPLLNPVIIILLVPIFTLIVIFLIIPSFVSRTSNIFNPTSLKKSWDSLNMVLVLVAVFCSLFLKQNDNVNVSHEQNIPSKSRPSDPYQWSDVPVTVANRLRRNSSSYPDIRQASAFGTEYNRRYQFFDDFKLNMYRPTSSPKGDGYDKKSISVKTSEIAPSPPPVLAADLAPENDITKTDATLLVERKRKRRQKVRKNIYEETEKYLPLVPPPIPPPPPPPLPQPRPPPPSFYKFFKKGDKSKRVYSISIPPQPPPLPPKSIFNNMFKAGSISKRFSQYSTSSPQPPPPPPPLPPPPRFNFNKMFKRSKSKQFPQYSTTIIPPPPPPLPSPPRFNFNNIFKTGNKNKRFENRYSTSVPPPPPPPRFNFNNMFKTGKKSNRQKNQLPIPTPPPPPPPLSSIFNDLFKTDIETRNTQFRSVTAPLPPHHSGRPPLPPFLGDFAKLENTDRSDSSSPGLEAVDFSSAKMDGGNELGSSVTCPSPDVNSKADSFIAKLRGEWRLEKLNQLHEGEDEYYGP